jgi:hypothetical protein
MARVLQNAQRRGIQLDPGHDAHPATHRPLKEKSDMTLNKDETAAIAAMTERHMDEMFGAIQDELLESDILSSAPDSDNDDEWEEWGDSVDRVIRDTIANRLRLTDLPTLRAMVNRDI